MNAQLAILNPLPAALQSPAWAAPRQNARRRRVGNVPIRTDALARFNQLLVHLQHFPLDCDQLASASRELEDQPQGGAVEGIRQRLQLAGTVERMVADPGWQAANEAVAPARVVVEYVRGEHTLFPRRNAPADRLDDAILVDAAWPQLAGEVDSYIDFCRLRAIEAELRGCPAGEFAFSRQDWQQARRAEAALIAHCRRVGASSYLPAATSNRFRVF